MNTYQMELMVRIGDLNYGGHLAHDRMITMLHDARCHFLSEKNQSEQNFYGAGLILKKIEVSYQHECFFKDKLNFNLWISEIKNSYFMMEYYVKNKDIIIANAKTQMVVFDYQSKKIKPLDQRFFEDFQEWII